MPGNTALGHAESAARRERQERLKVEAHAGEELRRLSDLVRDRTALGVGSTDKRLFERSLLQLVEQDRYEFFAATSTDDARKFANDCACSRSWL